MTAKEERGTPRVAVLTYARNEEKYLPRTLSSVSRQTLEPCARVIVDDGSSDGTVEIARNHGWDIVRMPDRGASAISTSELAKVVNAGLERLETARPRYVQIVGADDVLPDRYLESVSKRMDADPLLAIAGGRASSDKPGNPHPRGVRMVRTSFWKPMRYPTIPGWEAYLVYKALKEGYRVMRYDDIVFNPQRPPGRNWNWTALGASMKVLGYHPMWVAGRLMKTALRSPLSASNMLRGYLTERGTSDVAGWLRQHQRDRMLRMLQHGPARY